LSLAADVEVTWNNMLASIRVKEIVIEILALQSLVIKLVPPSWAAFMNACTKLGNQSIPRHRRYLWWLSLLPYRDETAHSL
jgi:hypothetical protein